MGESITNGVKQALKATFPGDGVEVRLTLDPPWNHAMISEEGQKFLNE